jgi:Clp amino terminal domain, pathogenicity island component
MGACSPIAARRPSDAVEFSATRPGRQREAGMLERFTERARHAMVRAIEEARSRRHAAVSPEHLLIALLHTDVLDPRVLRHTGVSFDTLVAEVERALETIPASTTGGNPVFSAELKRVLETAFAGQEAGARIGTDHLLLGLHADERTAAARILRASGAGLDLALRMGFLRDPRPRIGLDRMRFIATSRWRLPL